MTKMNLISLVGYSSRFLFINRALVVVTLICLLQACKKNNDGDNAIECGGTTKSFAANIKPIVQTSCAFDSDCHGSGSPSGPGPLLTYTEIFNARSVIRSAVLSRDMPKGATLTAAERSSIVCWIDNGAPNN